MEARYTKVRMAVFGSEPIEGSTESAMEGSPDIRAREHCRAGNSTRLLTMRVGGFFQLLLCDSGCSKMPAFSPTRQSNWMTIPFRSIARQTERLGSALLSDSCATNRDRPFGTPHTTVWLPIWFIPSTKIRKEVFGS